MAIDLTAERLLTDIDHDLADTLSRGYGFNYVRAREIAREQTFDEFSDNLQQLEVIVGRETAEKIVRNGSFAEYKNGTLTEYLGLARIVAGKLGHEFTQENLVHFASVETLKEYQSKSSAKNGGEGKTRTTILSFSYDGPSLDQRRERMEELMQAYERMANDNGYSVERTDDRLTITGPAAHDLLSSEEGIHTVVYQGDKFGKGRQYRVDVTIVVTEPQEEAGINLDDRKLKAYHTGSSGPGGQNVNKTNNNVRLVDEATGTTQVARGRSRRLNEKRAREGLAQKLTESRSGSGRIEMPTERVRRYDLCTLQEVTDSQTGTKMPADQFYRGEFMELLQHRLG